MKKVNELLIILIFILTAVLAAAVGFKAYDIYDTKRKLAKEQEEIEIAQVFARNEEAQSRVQEMEAEIQQLVEDREELERFISQIQNEIVTDSVTILAPEEQAVSGNGTVSGNLTVSGNSTVSGNAALSDSVTVSGNATVSGNGFFAEGFPVTSGGSTVSGGNSVSGNLFTPWTGSVSGNDGEVNYYDGSMTDNSIFDAWRAIYDQPEGMTLAQRRQLRTSLQETLEVNQADRERIAENRKDFSGIKVACLGDSITAAANLEREENYIQYSYPARLKELLGAEEVYNMGIGGSSIGRYWADAYVDRYREIPEDTDIIIVMGGTNDGFCVSEKEFGNLEERAYRTFCGDLDELMRGLRENYPTADIFFATPLPNVLQDYLMRERDYLLPQKEFVDVILTLAKEYGYQTIDLYNSNILDSHDANVVADYIPDGVHANHDGYQILAEHFAAEIVQYYNDGSAAGASETMSGNDAGAAESVSGSDLEEEPGTLSGNDPEEESGEILERDAKEEPETLSGNDLEKEPEADRVGEIEWVKPGAERAAEEKRKFLLQ